MVVTGGDEATMIVVVRLVDCEGGLEMVSVFL